MAPILKKVFKHFFSLLFAIKITSLYPAAEHKPNQHRRGSKFCFDPPPGIDIEERKLLVASIEQVGCYPLTIPTPETVFLLYLSVLSPYGAISLHPDMRTRSRKLLPVRG